MKPIVISHPRMFPNETDVVNKLFSQGLSYFHLRKPSVSEEALASWLDEILPEYLPRIIIHDRLGLATRYGLGGIHFNSATKSEYNNWIQWKGLRSWACHSIDELNVVPSGVNYVFLSPIFPSISKEGYIANWNLEALRQLLSKKAFPFLVIALGGVDVHKLDKVSQIGFDGAAFLGAIWGDLDSSRFDLENLCFNHQKIVQKCQILDHM